jgi:hypothetical protein
MNWEWRDMFPVKKLLTYTILSLILSVGSTLTRGLFKNDLQWFLICGSIFAAVYLGVIYRNEKEKAR